MSIDNIKDLTVSESDSGILTSEDVLCLTKIIARNQSVRVLNYQIDNYSEEKIGFTGSHRSLKINFQRPHADKSENVNIFVKGLPKDITNNTVDNLLYVPILMQESFFFEKLVPELLYDYQSEKWCPTYYSTMKNSIFIEDLKSSGYRMLDEFYDNLEVLKSTLASIARFHSCSILAEARLSRQAQHPVTLNKHFEGSIQEMMFMQEGDGVHWYNSAVNLACALAENLKYDAKKIRQVFNGMYEMVKPSKIHQNVICHGDLHIKNVLFANNKPLDKSILIDFQIIRYAPLVTDILHLLHINASRKFREERLDELIEHYHSVLVETIQIHDSMIESPTLDSIFKALKDFESYGLIIACVYIPLALLESKENKNLMEDSKALLNFLFGDRLEPVLAHMEVNESYKYIVESVITELAEKTTI